MKWTNKEIEILKDNTFSDAVKLLSSRSRQSLHAKCSRLRIPHESTWTNDEINILRSSTDKTISQIKLLLPKRTIVSIRHKLHNLGITRDYNALLRNKTSSRSGLSLHHISKIALNEKFNNIIDGCLLGDGCISKKTFNYTSTSYKHVKCVYDKIFKFGFINKIHKYKNNRNKIKLRDGIINIKPASYVYTYSITNKIIFPPIREKWYKNGTKIVPRDIKLTKITCLLWYLGDGTLSISNNGKNLILTLCTNGFDLKDHKILRKKITNDLRLTAQISKTGRIKYNGEVEYVLKLYSVNAYNFLKYIGRCPVSDYKHKWDIGRCKVFTKKCVSCGENVNYLSDKQYPIKYRCAGCRKQWNKKQIISEIHIRYNKKLPLSPRIVSLENAQLYLAGKRYFKSWKKAIIAAGYDYDQIRLTQKWSSEGVLLEIKNCLNNNEPFYQKLRDASRHYYGSFEKARKIAEVL